MWPILQPNIMKYELYISECIGYNTFRNYCELNVIANFRLIYIVKWTEGVAHICGEANVSKLWCERVKPIPSPAKLNALSNDWVGRTCISSKTSSLDPCTLLAPGVRGVLVLLVVGLAWSERVYILNLIALPAWGSEA